jgi:hypothetical protein
VSSFIPKSYGFITKLSLAVSDPSNLSRSASAASKYDIVSGGDRLGVLKAADKRLSRPSMYLLDKETALQQLGLYRAAPPLCIEHGGWAASSL